MKDEYKNVALCSSTDCRVADLCRRALGYKTITAEDKVLEIVNPQIVTGDENCPMYSYQQAVRYAKGFLQMESELPKKVYAPLKQHLLAHFGKNPFYEMRNGRRLISPENQQLITNLILSQGIAQPPAFDEYVEQDVWMTKKMQ